MSDTTIDTLAPARDKFGPALEKHIRAAADMNADGKADLVWQNDNGGPAVWLMDGIGVTTYGPALFNPGSDWRIIDAADFNGDGKADLVWQNNDGRPAIWLMDGVNIATCGPVPPAVVPST